VDGLLTLSIGLLATRDEALHLVAVREEHVGEIGWEQLPDDALFPFFDVLLAGGCAAEQPELVAAALVGIIIAWGFLTASDEPVSDVLVRVPVSRCELTRTCTVVGLPDGCDAAVRRMPAGIPRDPYIAQRSAYRIEVFPDPFSARITVSGRCRFVEKSKSTLSSSLKFLM
jgi:hypothetical protein